MPGIGRPHLNSRAPLIALLTLSAGLAACGKRGDPLPPFQHIPAPVPKAIVSQRGASILIEWEAPTKTTDGSELRLTQVEVLRRIVEPPPPEPALPEDPGAGTEVMPGVGETEGDPASGTVTPSEPQAVAATPPEPTTQVSAGENVPPEEPGPSEPAKESAEPTPESEPGQVAAETTTDGQTEGSAEDPLVMTPPSSMLQMSLKPKKFVEEARIIAKLDVDPSGAPLSFKDEWKPRFAGKQLEYAVRYVNPKGLKAAHSRPTSIEPLLPLPPPSELSAAADDGFVKIEWTESQGLAEWQEAAEASGEEGVTFEFGFNVYRKPAEGAYPSTSPVNRKRLERPAFEDRGARFGREWCYVVRAVAVPIQPQPPEGEDAQGGEGPAIDVPTQDQIEAAAENVPERLSAAGTKLKDAKQLLPPDPPSLIESESTNEVCLKPMDTFPPAAPSGLVALQTPDGMMISWSESDAQDLGGYLVYRAKKRRGPFEALTEEPIPLPSFTDNDLDPGETYFYAVSAVDTAAPINESERSSPIAAKAPQ